MKCRPAPDYERFNLRLNPDHEKHQQFIDLMASLPKGQKSEYVIDAVLAYGNEDERLLSLIRKAVRTEVENVAFVSAGAETQADVPESKPEETRTQRSKQLDTEGLKSFFSSL